MKAIFLFELMMALLCVSTTISSTKNVRYWSKVIPPLSANGGFVTCTCDGQNVTEELPKENYEDAFFSVERSGFCPKDSNWVCSFSKRCTNCTAVMTKCTAASKPKGFKCIQRGLEYISRDLPKNSIGHAISKRNYLGIKCFYPRTLETAAISCKRYNNSFIVCYERCIFGYTLKEGISRVMKCNYEEDKWSGPGVFQECKPFVNCKLRLVKVGSMTCYTATVRTAPYCIASCNSHGMAPAFSNQTFKCTTSGKWEPKLPKCLEEPKGIKLALAPAPKVKEHASERLLKKWTPPAFATNIVPVNP